MRGTIFKVLGLAAGAMLLVGLGITANASAHHSRSFLNFTGIHHEATAERTESPEPSDSPETKAKPEATQPADNDAEAVDEEGDHQTGTQDGDSAPETDTETHGGSGDGNSGGGD
jgi:hypothetical protein